MANGGNINYNVRFNADTSGLNRPVQELQKIQESLKAVQKINIQLATAGKAPEEIQQIIRDLTEAQNAAKLVETALKKSFSTKLNTFNITNFNNELKKSGTNITEIGQKLMKSGAVGAAAFRNIENQIGKVNLQVKQSNKLFDEMATTMMNSIKWGITSSIWNNMTGSIEKAWGFAKKLDSSLNDIRIVTNKSAQDMEKFAVQANKAAKNLGSSTTGYTDASLIYYQQGLSDAEVQARTETTLKAANVTGQSAAEVSEQLTAVWNGYKVSAEEAELYVDKLSAVAATTAADLEELSTGMSKVASAANIMGVDIDQLNAQLATVVSVTRQAPESVGTAFKTIYARMGDIEAGLDTETSLGEYTKKMSEMGFNVLDTNGKLRDMGSVIEEIGNKWTNLSREQQVALSQTMAGTRQYNNLLALFDNWDEYTESLETSRDAAGSLQKQQDTYMESMEAHLQKLSTEGERVYNNLFDANAVNPLIDALTTLISLLADFVDGIGGIGPVLLMLGSIGTKAFSKQIGEGISTSIINSKNAKKNAEELASQYQILDDISKKFSDDLVGQQAAIDKSINSLARQGLISQERADELRAFSSALGETGNRIDELKIKQEEYNKVAKEGKENAQQLDKDNQDQSNYTSTATLLDRISTQRETAKIDDNTPLEDAIPAYRALNKELDRRNEKLEQTREKLDQTNISLKQNIANNQSLANIISQQGDISKAYQSPDFQHQVGNINKNIKDIQEQYKAFEKDLSEEEKANFEGALSRYQAHLQRLREAGSAGTLTSEQIKQFQEYATEVQQEFEKAITNGFNEGLENAEAAIENVRQAARQAAEGSLEQNQNELKTAEEEAEGLQQDFNDEIANEQLKQRITLITELVGAVGELSSAMQMVSNIVNIAMDDSLSVEEKLKQIIPLLIAAVPIVISGFKGLQASLAGLFPSGIAAAGGLAAAGTASAAAGTAATGAAGAFTALWAAMGPIGWIILGITAAVAGLTVIIKLATDAYNADAIAAEKAAKAYERASEAASQAEAAYVNLKDTLSKYDEQVKGLEELTEGTDEYKRAVQEANQAVLDLIENGDILASQVYRDENGVLVISDRAREEAEKKAEEKRNNTLAAQNYAHAESVAAQQKADRTAFDREQSSTINGMALAENRWQFDQLREEWISMSQKQGEVASFNELSQTETYQSLYNDLLELYSSVSHDNDQAKRQVEAKMSEFYISLADGIDSFVKESESASQESSLYIQEAVQNSLKNNASFLEKTSGQQSVIATQYAKKIDISENSPQYQKLKDQAQQTVNTLSDEEIKKQFAEYMGYTIKEGKLFDSNENEISYAKEEAKTTLVQKYAGENLKDYDEEYYNQIESTVAQVSQTLEKIGLEEKTGDAILNLLTATSSKDRNFNTAEINYEDYEQLISMTEEDLNKLISNIDFSSFDISADEFVDRIQEGLENTDWSSVFASMVSSAENSVKLINDALDKFKIGEKLDDDVISALEQKFPELTRIWDKTSKEYYNALKQAQEDAEINLSSSYDKQGKYEYGEIGAKQTDYKEALDQFKEISGKSQEERFQETYNEAWDEVAETATNYIAAAEKAGYGRTSESGMYYVASAEYGETEAGKSSSEYIAYENAHKYANELEAINSALQEGKELTEEQKELIDGDYNEALENAAEAAKNLKAEVEDTFKADYELEISITNDLLSDVDEIVTKAENARTAVEMIGEGFKVSAENSEELLTIFPELAHNAQVLADGTIQLDDEVVKEVLDNDALEIDSMTDVTATAIDNRIAELEADKAAMEAKLEDLHNTSVAEFNVQEFLGENYQEFKEEEVNANALAAQDEVSNSALSAKAVITNWQAKIDAAKTYAAIAAAAEAPGHDVSGVADNVQEYVDNTVSSVDTSDSVNMTEEEKKQKEEELERINQELYNLTEDYLTNKIASDEKQIAQLIQSKSELYAGIKNIETAATEDNIDLLDDEIDRYHDINIQLDDIAKKIERINKAQEHLVGADLIASQKQSLKLLEEEIKLRREKQKIQQAEAVELQGHLLADGVAFNEDGSVANYAEVMKKQMAKVNTAKQSGNEEAAKAAEKNYEAFKKNFERYEELRDDIEDLADEITDMMYEQISKKIETFKTKLEIKLDTAKAQKEWKEFTNQLFISANDALSQITAQSDLLKSDRSIASKATSKYDKIVNEGMKAQALVEGTAEKGTTSVYATYSKELGKYIFDQAKWQEDMEAAQQEAQEATLQIIDDVDSLGETAIGLLEDTIAAEKEQLVIYDDMNSLLNHAMKLQELFVGEEDYDSKAKMYEEQAKVASEKTKTAKDRRQYALDNIDSYAEAYKEAKQKYDEAKANGEGDVTVLEKQLEITKQAYEDMKNELKDSTEDFYTSIEEQIEIAKNAYINTINKAMADMENKMTGGKGLSYISDEWDLINKNADRYLDTVNSTYEVQSLEAKYRKAIDSTSSLSAQKKLNKAMEEELKALREKDKLSQYDIDRANKKYEITMKQIALEEAQANKSSMRLRRDAQGNYSYQFVADENATAEAQQELLALQNELYNFDKERYQQTLDDALAAYQEYQQKMLEAAQINDPEKRAEMEKLITEQYQEYLLAITADNEVAKQNLQNSTMEALQGMYDVNSENFDIMTKGMFEDFKDADGNIKIDFQNLTETELSALMGNLVTGWDGSVQSMIDKIANPGPDGFKEQSKSVFETAQEAAKTLDDTLKTLGDNFSGEGNTADKILNDVTEINDKMDDFKTEVLDPTVDKGKEELPDAWATYKTGVENAAKAIKKLSRRLTTVYTKASDLAQKLQDIASQSPINIDINYNTTGDATTPSGNYTGGGSGRDEDSVTPTEEEDKYIGTIITWKKKIYPWKYKDSGGNPISLSMAELWGEEIENLSRGRNPQELQTAMKNAKIEWEVIRKDGGKDSNSYLLQNKQTGAYGHIEASRIASLDTGGYTGEWGAEGRMAMLHEKEIVLNKQDTANILNAVSIVRGIGDLINNLSANLLGNLSQRAIDSTLGMRDFEQNVHITAEFPNVSSSSEIEDALRNLTNVAAQRAFNTRI